MKRLALHLLYRLFDLERAILSSSAVRGTAVLFKVNYEDALQVWDDGITKTQESLDRKRDDIPESGREAVRRHRRAVKQGDASAKNNLGVMYAVGRGVPKDYETAVKWFQRAAEDGGAQYDLGLMFKNGHGVPKNDKMAASLWQSDVEQEGLEALLGLGLMYEKGQGVNQNYEYAMELYKRAAEIGAYKAFVALGVEYRDECEGVTIEQFRLVAKKREGAIPDILEPQFWHEHQNDGRPVKWYRHAIKKKLAFVQYCLGAMYADARGVPQNDKVVAGLYRRSAEQGYTPAQNKIGMMCESEQGNPQNVIRAYMWFNLAATNGDKETAEARDRVAKKMTPEQIAEAQDLAVECQKKGYKDC